MRVFVMVTILALAGCNEHAGWNPNYPASASPYGQYRVARETALTTGADTPVVIPLARPFYAPQPQPRTQAQQSQGTAP